MAPKPPIKGSKYSNSKCEDILFICVMVLLVVAIMMPFYAYLTLK